MSNFSMKVKENWEKAGSPDTSIEEKLLNVINYSFFQGPKLQIFMSGAFPEPEPPGAVHFCLNLEPT